MSSEETATAVEVAFNEAAIGFRYTMLLRHLAEHDLTEFCQQELGDGPESLVATLLQGHPNPSTATGSTLEELAAFASTHSDLAEALGAGRHDRLDALPGGEEFTHRLSAFLEEYGWRAEAWELVHLPTWAENPTAVLTFIARYLRDKDHLPSAAMSRAVEQRLAAMQELEGRLDQSKLGRFRQLLSACDGYVFMSESRYHAIVTLLGSVRVPALALGSKLSAVGVIDEPDDIFFLTLTEAQKQAVASERPMQDVVAGRKADLERWQELVPPHFIGSAPRPGDMPPRAAFSSHQAEPVSGVLVVSGQGASRGTHRALARVILNLSDAHRLQPGEILVSRWTAAPWAPLFAIAGGVVTDSGGILDHAAICAREYGIPCVVATRDGTSRIPDGATVTIDGGKGTVVIE
jgi:rifampicin phosphotransferase